MAVSLPSVVLDPSTTESLCESAGHLVCSIKRGWLPKELLYKVYTDGITNKLVGVYHKDGSKEDQMLVRVYGENTDLFIDRDAEKKYIQYLSPHGCGPTLYGSFGNGICYSYVSGNPLTTEDVIKPPVFEAVAKHMAKLNSIPCLPESKEPMLFSKIKLFLSLLPDDFSQVDKLKKVCSAGYSKSCLQASLTELQAAVSSLQCPLALSHNDLLLANIIWQPHAKAVQFIDFEYTATNYQPYDVANHFCEFAGVDTVDYNLYPSEDLQRKWLQIYLSHLHTPSSRPLDWWVGAVAVLALCAHTFWGVWALVQAINSSIDFDFAGYGMIRLNECKRRKEAFLKLGEKAVKLL